MHAETIVHQTAMFHGQLFFDTYCSDRENGKVVEIGSQNVNGSLREVCPSRLSYVGVDFI